MGFVDKLIGSDHSSRELASNDYIDLTDWVENESHTEDAASAYVKVAEIHDYEDLQEYMDYVYDGNMLILDFSSVADDEFLLKRITGDLRKLANDVGGDIAGYQENTIIVTPTSVKVDRKKLRGA